MDEGTYVSLPVMIWPLMLPLRLMPNLGINLQQKTNGATAFQFMLDKSGHAPFRMDNWTLKNNHLQMDKAVFTADVSFWNQRTQLNSCKCEWGWTQFGPHSWNINQFMCESHIIPFLHNLSLWIQCMYCIYQQITQRFVLLLTKAKCAPDALALILYARRALS